jgi:hypothetical protein
MDSVDAFQIKTSHYIIGAVALVTALSWNSGIRSIIDKCFPLPNDEIMAGIIYAIVMTIFLILLIEYLPNTTSELPKGTQEKIKDAEERERLQNRITRLELMNANILPRQIYPGRYLVGQ